MGNGYNSPTQKPFLFALNAQTGATVSKIDLCAAVPTACNLAASNGLSTVIAVNSGGQLAGYANIVYAGICRAICGGSMSRTRTPRCGR